MPISKLDVSDASVGTRSGLARSVTHEFGTHAFDKALESERNDLSADSALAVVAAPAQPEADKQAQEVRVEQASNQEGGDSGAQPTERLSTSGKSEDSTATTEAEPGQEEVPVVAKSAVKDAAAEIVKAETAEPAEPELQVSAADGDLEVAEGESSDPATTDDIATAADDTATADDTTTSDPESEISPELEIEVEVEQSEGDAEIKASSVEAEVESSTRTSEPVAPQPFTSARMPVSAVDAWGRQAFSRATASPRPDAAASAPVDVAEMAEKIAKTRGSMSGSRARIVFGEGNERVAMIVTVRNGAVHIDARAADAAFAQSLEAGANMLNDALAQHGLSLGDMQTSSDDDTDPNELDAEPKGEGKPTQKHTARVRAGVRVVA